jgi:membrane protein
MSFIKRIWILVTSTFRIWEQANSSRMAAAMTYYTMLSLAPLLMIAVAIAGYVYDDKLASQELIEQVGAATSPAIAEIIAGLISNATRPSSGILASSISLLILFYGASGVFSQLYETFNVIWQVPVESRTGFKFTIQKRLIGIGMVLIAGVSLIGTVALGSVIAYLEHLVQDSYPIVTTWLNLADRSLSLLLMPFVLALMFWFFPATKIKWRDVWPAGVLTALLIAGSRYLIEFYLRFSSTSEVYGAAGSLVVLLIWIYITGLVVFFGAAFSHAWSDTFGSRSSQTANSDKAIDSGNASPSREPNGRDRTIESESPGKITSNQADSSPPISLQRRAPDS